MGQEGSVPPFGAAQSEPMAGLNTSCFSSTPSQDKPSTNIGLPLVTALFQGLVSVKLIPLGGDTSHPRLLKASHPRTLPAA